LNDYQWYIYSCWTSGIRPISARRFQVLLDTYRRDFTQVVDLDLMSLPPRRRAKLINRWSRICEIARLADAGRGTITAGTVSDSSGQTPPGDRPEFGGSSSKDDPPGAAPGVREPLRPIAPLLTGSAARPVPRPDMAYEPRWYVR
jgi:hypothetical protein